MINNILADKKNKATVFVKQAMGKVINADFVFKNSFILFIKSFNKIYTLINNFL
jgi:hypothetical protein